VLYNSFWLYATWNFIPISIKNCSSLYSFKRHLKSHLIAQLITVNTLHLATWWLSLLLNVWLCARYKFLYHPYYYYMFSIAFQLMIVLTVLLYWRLGLLMVVTLLFRRCICNKPYYGHLSWYSVVFMLYYFFVVTDCACYCFSTYVISCPSFSVLPLRLAK